MVEAPSEEAPHRRRPASARTRLVLLGTGTPNADPERSGPALAIVVDDTSYLVDAGPGVVRRAQAAAQGEPPIAALAADRLARVFITHLHSDHALGLADLMLTPWVLGRAYPLEVHGPPGIAAMTEHLHAAFAQDIRIRTEGLEGASPLGHGATVHEVDPGLVFEDERVRVTAFAVPHGSWPHAYGYRFETPDRTIVVSGDTGPSDAVVRACDGCDVLVHEVYSTARFATHSPSTQAYHASFHTSSRELGQLASRARPRLLVLYHQLLWGAEPASVVAEVRTGWDGEVHFGRDLDVL